jgi:hypothetical protein
MKNKFLILCVLCVLCGLMVGCQNQTLSQEAKLFETEAGLFTAAVKVATVLQDANAFTPQETLAIGVTIRQTQVCLNAEAAYLKDPCNVPQPDWFNCAAGGIGQILDKTKGKVTK